MFGFDALPEIMKVVGVAQRFGAEAVTVPREDCGLTLAALSRGEHGKAAAPVSVKMLVFCGMDTALDDLLAMLRQSGVTCLKAVMTPTNQNWTPGRLYRELEQERRTLR